MSKSSESLEELASSIAVSLGITRDEALDLGTLGIKLAERNITFVIEGPYAQSKDYAGVFTRVKVFVYYRFGSRIKNIGGNNFAGDDPLEMVLTGAKWILEALRNKSVEDLAVERAPFWYRVMNRIKKLSVKG